jgi:hypothetical protein
MWRTFSEAGFRLGYAVEVIHLLDLANLGEPNLFSVAVY